MVLDVLTHLGDSVSNTLLVLVVVLLACLRLSWRCGLCGKETHGNIVQFIFQWCDHDGGPA